MNLDLKGKSAIVCGSTQGIGKAIAEEIAEMGASLTLIARNEERLQEVKNGLTAAKRLSGKTLHLVKAVTGIQKVTVFQNLMELLWFNPQVWILSSNYVR